MRINRNSHLIIDNTVASIASPKNAAKKASLIAYEKLPGFLTAGINASLLLSINLCNTILPWLGRVFTKLNNLRWRRDNRALFSNSVL